jgi:hypothetical protein
MVFIRSYLSLVLLARVHELALSKGQRGEGHENDLGEHGVEWGAWGEKVK